MPVRSWVSVAVLLLLTLSHAWSEGLPNEQDRLLSTAKLWVTVKYFHPYLGYRKIDWDHALVKELPAVRSARSPAEYADALGAMLGELHDPDSFVQGPAGSAKRVPDPKQDKPAADAERIWVHYGAASTAFVNRPARQVETVELAMDAGITATLRLSEPVTKALAAAPAPQAEPTYDSVAYPDVNYRILAAFKLWGVIRSFFAYKDLMDQDWDQAFSDFLPKFINAKDAREYNFAIAEAMTLLDDSNATLSSAALDSYFGVALLGLRTRLVEKKPLVTEVLDEDARKAGVQVGDIITKVEGEDVVARIHRYIPYISASTDQSLAAEVMKRVFNGPEDSTVRLTLEGRNQQQKEVTLKRSRKYLAALSTERSGEITKFLSKAIGYVDLDRLDGNEIDSMFEKFQGATALIFDARGTLRFAPELLSARLVEKSDAPMAIVTGPLNLTPDLPDSRTLTQTASFFRVETVRPSPKPHYHGKTVMLIDERTRGAAERLGLQLEAANNTLFVGSLSAGADSEIESFVLPGGVTITYSASDIRHGNGGKLQRVGLQPTESAPPTVSAIRNGRDEALEKAMDAIVR
jgi:C-terminal processing protease CtpA/Prc